MAKKVKEDDEFEYDEDTSDELKVLELNLVNSAIRYDARRCLEQLREEKELERMISEHHYYDLF